MFRHTRGKQKLEDKLENQWNSLMDTLNEPYLDSLGEKQKLEDQWNSLMDTLNEPYLDTLGKNRS